MFLIGPISPIIPISPISPIVSYCSYRTAYYAIIKVMDKTQTIIVFIIVVLVVAAIVYVILSSSNKTSEPIGVTTESPSSSSAVSKTYKAEVPKDAVLSKPVTEVPAAPNVKEKLGFFDMTVTKNGYEPSSLTVKKGNLVQLRLTAVDADYDWSMPFAGLYKMIKKGEIGEVGFGATLAGTFIFECKDYCPAKNSKGTVVVMP